MVRSHQRSEIRNQYKRIRHTWIHTVGTMVQMTTTPIPISKNKLVADKQQAVKQAFTRDREEKAVPYFVLGKAGPSTTT